MLLDTPALPPPLLSPSGVQPLAVAVLVSAGDVNLLMAQK
jgi:hypothetical protein